MYFPKFVNMVKNTPFTLILLIFALLNDVHSTHVHCLVLNSGSGVDPGGMGDISPPIFDKGGWPI